MYVSVLTGGGMSEQRGAGSNESPHQAPARSICLDAVFISGGPKNTPTSLFLPQSAMNVCDLFTNVCSATFL